MLDAYGNPVAPTAVTLALGNNPGNDTLHGTTTVQTVNGVATFSDLKLIKAAQGYTLTATVGRLARRHQCGIQYHAGRGGDAAFTTQPSTTPAGSAITPAVQVTVPDAYGNLVTTTAVTLALGNNPGNDTLIGTLTVNTVNGVATFSNLKLTDSRAGLYADRHGRHLPAVTSAPFNITPPRRRR